jgi:ABC-type phosphate/phosphonate transport system substrate-binding protein
MNRTWARRRGAAALAVAMVVVIHSGRCRAEEESPSAPGIRIGLVNTLFRDTPESLFKLMTRPLKSLMESQTGMTGTFDPGGECRILGRELQDDKFQLAVFHGVEFAWVRQKHPDLKPLVIAIRDGQPMYACLVVKNDSKVTCLADLDGKALAMCRQCREHCRLFLERRCEGCGKCPHKFFAKITAPTDTEDALDDVVDGAVDAAIVDSAALERYQRMKADRFAKLKTAVKSEAFPPAVIAYKPGVLSEEALKRFKTGLITANQNPKGKQLLTMCRITCFEAVPENYEEMLLSIAKAYPPPAETQQVAAPK